MSEFDARCTICQSCLDEEDLFCANCGTEAPTAAEAGGVAADRARMATCNFDCAGCGASMSYEASEKALRCPFCGSVDLRQQQDAKILAPRRVVPFRIPHADAERHMRQWLGQGFWRPGDLAHEAAIVGMRPVYVPYWVFESRTHTYWTADTSQTPPGARADWYPLAGEHRGRYAGLLVGASGALSAWETAQLCPFDLGSAVPPEEVDLENVTVEQFSVPRKYARPLARQSLEQGDTQAVASQYVPGRARNVHVNLLADGMASEPVLLPVWIMAYRYRDEVYRFLINGQTGQATGQAPTSWAKVGAAVAIAVAAGIVILAVMALIAGS